MGSSYSKEHAQHPSQRSEEEKQAALKRQAIASAAIRKALGLAASAKVPTIGIALSGGGWRSMTGSVAFLDGLAEAGLLDAVTYAAGVSGGAWVLYQWMLMTANHNAFHKPGVRNAWFHSSTPSHVDPKPTTTYDGLVRMRNTQHVRDAAKFTDDTSDGLVSEAIQTLNDASLLIPAVLFSTQLGKSPIERWVAFLKDDLLFWLPKGHDGAIPNTGHVADGTSPILLSAFVASKDGHFDWMESSPFGLRRLPPHGTATIPNSRLSLKYENGHVVDDPKVWHAMAAAGSAFGVDMHDLLRDKLPSIDAALHAIGISPDIESIVGGVSSKYFETGKQDAVTFDEARDAGILENIAYPLLFPQSSDREVDLILVVENSQADTPSAKSIEDAESLGLIPTGVYDVTTASKPLDASEGFVRVFKPKVKGYPVVVLLFGLQDESTFKLTATEKEVRDQVRTMRERVKNHFLSAIAREIRALVTTEAGAGRSGASHL